MGEFLNRGNKVFTKIRNKKYVDKSGLIGLVNEYIGKDDPLICVSRPRRFGKSLAAKMLCAYYDVSCDSRALFDDLKAAELPDYKKHLNQYNVIYMDITKIVGETDYDNLVPYIKENVTREITELYPDVRSSGSFMGVLESAVDVTGREFVMIIDEWDVPIRETDNHSRALEQYLQFLRAMFKSDSTDIVFAAVYMTGILPIKKTKTGSALSNFKEFTMIYPRRFGEYVGFTEAEVEEICKESGGNMDQMKEWYDGYSFEENESIYNPSSVMEAIETGDYISYWTETSVAEELMNYISKGYSGLSKIVAELIGGVEAQVDTNGFANDLVTFKNANDVLILLIHLGYLSYNKMTKKVRIPNEEIRQEFFKAVKEVKHKETNQRVQESDQLLHDTISMNEKAVAAQIQKVHLEETTPLHYNREEDLRSVIKLAYYTYKDHYLQWEELPSGTGYADVVYFPKKDSWYPALVIELKWNREAEGAIDQIKNKQYPDKLKGYGGDILLVAVSYDKATKEHTCMIEKI